MEKVFEDLEKIKESFGCDPAYYGLAAEFENVEQALTELKAIAEAEPSEALKLLEHIIHSNNLEWMPEIIRESVKRDLGIAEQYILKAQELEKENAELLQAVALFKQKLEDTDNIKVAQVMMKQLNENLKLKKENTEYKNVLSIIKIKGTEKYLLEEFDNFEAYKKNMNDFYADQFVIDWNNKEQLIELRIYNEEEFNLLKRWYENDSKMFIL